MLVIGSISCGLPAANPKNAGANTTNSTAGTPATPVAANTAETFTAQKLIDDLKVKKDKLNVSLKGKEITISGNVASVEPTEIAFFAGQLDRVHCTSYGFNGNDKFNMLSAYAREFAQGTSHNMPVASAKGVYKAGILSDAKNKDTVIYLDNCEILSTSRM